MVGLKAGAPPFVAARTRRGGRLPSLPAHLLLLAITLLGLSSFVLAQAPGQSGVRPSAFITSTRASAALAAAAATPAPGRGGTASQVRPASTSQQASTATASPGLARATNFASSADTPLSQPSNSSAAMAPGKSARPFQGNTCALRNAY